MSRFILTFFVTLTFAFTPAYLLAQSESPTPAETVKTPEKIDDQGVPATREGVSSKHQKIFDDLEYEKEFIQGSSKIMTDEKWEKLSLLTERYAYLFCYLENPKQNLYSKKKDPYCRYYLNRLKKFSPENVVYHCAHSGITSKECQQNSLNQFISTTMIYSSDPIFFIDVRELLLPPIDKSMLSSLNKTNIQAAKNNYQKKSNPQNWEALIKALNKLLLEECRGTKIIATENRPAEHMKASNIIKYRKTADDPLFQALESYEKDPERLGNLKAQGLLNPPATPKPKIAEPPHPFEKSSAFDPEDFNAEPFWRVRSLSQSCMQTVEEALSISPNLPTANCLLHGDYSYFCQISFDNEHLDNPFKDKREIPKEPDNSSLQTF